MENCSDYFPRSSWKNLALLTLLLILLSNAILADSVRVATYNVSLGRNGPGLLVKDLLDPEHKQISDIVQIIQHLKPDILLILDFDNDYQNIALEMFIDKLSQGDNGVDYPYYYAKIGNEGVPSEIDLDNDGKPREWNDAYGFGRFEGNGGMVLLSQLPINYHDINNFNEVLWIDLPDHITPKNKDGSEYFTDDIINVFRLSSRSHWDVPIEMPDGKTLHVLSSHPTPPVFDGPEDLNGLRNAAEIMFWVAYLDRKPFKNQSGEPVIFDAKYFVIAGGLNNDPADGEGHKAALNLLLQHPSIIDPAPTSLGAVEASHDDSGANQTHLGNPALDTVDWGPNTGNMRVDYVLVSKTLHISNTGVFWPPRDTEWGKITEASSTHRLVWVDIFIE